MNEQHDDIDNQRADTLALINSTPATLPIGYQKARTALAECIKGRRMPELDRQGDRVGIVCEAGQRSGSAEHGEPHQGTRGRACGSVIRSDAGSTRAAHRPARGGSSRWRQAEAERAGFSQDQRRQAQTIARFANENPEQFEAMVEGDRPPTISALAEVARVSIRSVRVLRFATAWE